MSCAGRHHQWSSKAAGGVCTKCGDKWRPPGRPKGSGEKMKAGEAVASRLARTLGTAAPPADISGPGPAPAVPEAAGAGLPANGSAPPAPAAGGSPVPSTPAAKTQPEPPPEPSPFWMKAAKRFTKVFCAAADAAIEICGKEDGESDPEDEADFALAAAQQFTVWFPNTALTPAKQMILSGGFIVGEKWMTARKIPKKPARAAIGGKSETEPPSDSSDAPAAISTPAPTLRPV